MSEGICGERTSAGICLREPGHVKRHKYTKEELVSGTTLAEIGEQRGHESLGTAEMSTDEAVEVLVRSDPIQNQTPPAPVPSTSADGQEVRRTQGKTGMFHVLSQIDDGVHVAWDMCRGGGQTHSIANCQCRGGPVEPPYVTKWREEWIAKRDKKAAKEADKALTELAVRVETPVQVEPTMGDKALDAALEAVEAVQPTEADKMMAPGYQPPTDSEEEDVD